MSMVPLVSVLMTAYNREKYISEAIRSVLNSTLRDFELIIVDDASQDKTLQIALEYQEKDKRIKVFVNEKNLGDYPNRNKAASYAIGKYLKYVDADDLIYPWGLEILVNCMERFPEAGWGLCSLPPNSNRPFPFMLGPSESYLYEYKGPGLFYKAPLSSIIKRNIFEKENGFRLVRHYGDSEMWHRLAKRYPIVLIGQGIVWWRNHADQEAVKRKRNPLIGIKTINSALYNLSDISCPLNDKDRKDAIRHLKFIQKKQIIKQIFKGELMTAYKMFRIAKNRSEV